MQTYCGIQYCQGLNKLGKQIYSLPRRVRELEPTPQPTFRFQAYIHTCAIMWKVCFQELRALTNTKQLSLAGLNVNPMELNDIYEHVWNLGVLLQTNQCLSILQPGFRAWPKVSLTCTLLLCKCNTLTPPTITDARGRGIQCGVLRSARTK